MSRNAPASHPGWLVVAAVLDLGVLAVLVTASTVTSAVLGLTVHVLLTAFVWSSRPAGTRRTLEVAWMLSLPGLGLLVALATIGVRGEGDLMQFDRGQVPSRTIGPSHVVRTLSGHIPMCERLVSGVSAVRRSALAGLAIRNDAEAIEILRWAVRDPDGDLALDAALTLEELSDGYELCRAATLHQLAEAPTFETAVAAGDVVLEALTSRLVADAMISTLASEAHAHYAQAQCLASGSGSFLTVRLARLALLTLRPNDALELLEPALLTSDCSPELQPLYNDALIAARRCSVKAVPATGGAL